MTIFDFSDYDEEKKKKKPSQVAKEEVATEVEKKKTSGQVFDFSDYKPRKVTPPTAPVVEPKKPTFIEKVKTGISNIVSSISPRKKIEEKLATQTPSIDLTKDTISPPPIDTGISIYDLASKESATSAKLTPKGKEVAGKAGKVIGDFAQDQYNKSNLPPVVETGKSLYAGFGDVVAGTGKILKWQGVDGMGDQLIKKGGEMQKFMPDTTEFNDGLNWKDAWNPRLYTTLVARGSSFTLAMLPLAFVGGGAGVTVAGALGLGKVATIILGAIGSSALATPFEAATEAGSTYDEMIQQGKSREEADKAADKTFKGNALFLGLSNALQFLPFLKGADTVSDVTRTVSKTAKIIKGVTVAGGEFIAEGTEEVGQKQINLWSQDKPFDLTSRDTIEEFVLGGLQGLVFTAGGAIIDSATGKDVTAQVTQIGIEQAKQTTNEIIDRVVTEVPGISDKITEQVNTGIDPNVAKQQVLEKEAEKNKDQIEKIAKEVITEKVTQEQEMIKQGVQKKDVTPLPPVIEEEIKPKEKVETEVEDIVEKNKVGDVVGKAKIISIATFGKNNKYELSFPDGQTFWTDEKGLKSKMIVGKTEIKEQVQSKSETDWDDNYAEKYQELENKIQDLNTKEKTATVRQKEDIKVIKEKYLKQQAKLEDDFINKYKPEPKKILKTVKKEIKTGGVEAKSKIKKELTLAPSKATTGQEVMIEANEAGMNRTIDNKRWKKNKELEYFRPLVGKTELKTFITNSKEFRDNPVFTVDENKDLVFKSKTTEITLKPEGMAINVEKLKAGDKIRVDVEAIKKAKAGIYQTRVYKEGKTYASMDTFADLKNLTEAQGQIKAVEFPELLTIARELMGEFPTVKRPRFRKSLGGYPLGLFIGDGKGHIVLNPEIFKNPDQAAKTFAHEIGHLSDYIPEGTLKRGNLISRIASLRFGMKQYFAGYKQQEQINNLIKERETLTEQRKGTEGEENKTILKQIKELNKQINKLKENPKLQNKEIVEELKRLTQFWKPFDEEKSSANFIKYRYAPAELYADAISVLFNDPVMLKDVAPKFWKGFFEFIDSKPEVKQNFLSIWDLLNKGEEAVFSKRQEDIRKMFKRGEDQFALLRQEQIKKDKDIVFRLKHELIDKNQRMIDLVEETKKKGVKISDDANPIYWLEEQNYVGGVVKNWVEKNIQPVYTDLKTSGATWEDFGEVLYHERVINERGAVKNVIGQIREMLPETYDSIIKDLPGDIEERSTTGQLEILKKTFGDMVDENGRSYYDEIMSALPKGIANPLGFDVDSSKKQLAYLEKTLGETKWNAIQKNLPKYRAGIQQAIAMAEKAELYKPEMLEMIKANPAYATFQVIDYMDLYIPASIKQQTGTLKEITNPATATIIKTISTIRASERNMAKRSVIDFLKENHPNEVKDAKTRWTGRYQEPLASRENNEMLTTVIEKGAVKGYYVDPYIAESVEYMTTGHTNAVISILRFFNGKLFRPMFITFNLGFQSFNLMRDFVRTYKNIPNMTLLRTVKRYGQAIPASFARAWDIPNATISEMEQSKLLGITYNDVISGMTEADKQIDAVIAKAGLSVLKGKKTNLFLTIPKAVLDFISKLGNTIETIPKVAGYKELNGKMPSREMASFIRTSVGSPDFLRKGAGYKWYNEVFLFSNAIKEGIRSDLNVAFKNPKTRSGFWWKTAKVTFLPKMLMFAAAAGLFGELLKDMFKDASEYDKTNYTIVPIGKDKNNQTIYLRIPQDETGRLLGGILWKALNIVEKKKLTLADVTALMSYTGGQLPGISPTIEAFSSIAQFMAGENPYDFFRGRNVIPDDAFAAGGMYALKPFVTWQINQLGGGVFLKGYVSEQSPNDKTWVQKMVEMPVVSNILGRWIKVSNYGKTEDLRQISNEQKSKDAKRRLEERELINDAVKEYKSGSGGMSKRLALEKRLIKDIVGNAPYDTAEKTKITNLKKKFKIGILRGESDANINALISATTNNEKVQLLKEMKATMKTDEYNALIKTLKKEQVVSDQVLKDLKKQSMIMKDKDFLSLESVTPKISFNLVKEAYAAEGIENTANKLVWTKDIRTGWEKFLGNIQKLIPGEQKLENPIEGITVEKLNTAKKKEYYETMLSLRNEDPDWYYKNIGNKVEKRILGYDLGSEELVRLELEKKKEVSKPMPTGRAKKGVGEPVQDTETYKGLAQRLPDESTDKIIKKETEDKIIRPEVVAAMLWQESGYQPDARNDGGEKGIDRGIAQINSKSHPDVTDAQADDPEFAIKWLVDEYKRNLKKFNGDINRAIAAHNVGSGGASVKGSTPSGLGTRGQRYVDNVARNLTPEMRKELGIKTTYDKKP